MSNLFLIDVAVQPVESNFIPFRGYARSNMFKVTRLTPRICSAKRSTLIMVRNKFTKEMVIRRLMKEQKQCFGALLETQSQKRKRLKREKKGIVASKVPESGVNSELSWMQKSSKIRYVRFQPQDAPSSVSAAAPEKVASPKSFNKYERASIEAAEGLLTKFENKVPFLMDNKNPLAKAAVQKRILRRLSVYSSAATKAACEKTFMLRPEDIIKNINEARLFEEKDTNYPDVWAGREIISVSRTEAQECLAYPSVTRILNATMSDKAKQMLAVWMAKKIEELGQEGFEEYKSELLENGKVFHSAIESTLRGSPVEVPLSCKLCFESLEGVLGEVKSVRAIESHVVHRDLGYRGVLDCVALYRGDVCLIDWKKCDRSKELLSSTYDAPLQIASYIGALNADNNYPLQIRSGLLVIAYTIGNKPCLHHIDETKLQYYWKQWLERLKKYYAMQKT